MSESSSGREGLSCLFIDRSLGNLERIPLSLAAAVPGGVAIENSGAAGKVEDSVIGDMGVRYSNGRQCAR